MPLSGTGQSILNAFIQEYGGKKGKEVFYAKENKDRKFARLVKHGKKRKRKS